MGRLGHATKLKWNAPGEWIWSQEPVQEPLIGIHTGLAVFTGSEDRQHAYVALTRGTDENTAYVFTVSCPSRRLTAAIKKIPIGGHGFPAGGQLVTDGIRGLGREKQLPRRLRCSGLAALRSAVGLPPD